MTVSLNAAWEMAIFVPDYNIPMRAIAIEPGILYIVIVLYNYWVFDGIWEDREISS